jgi:hypothetical protein
MHDHIRCSQEQLLPRKTHRIRRYHLSTRTTRIRCTTIFDALKNNYQGRPTESKANFSRCWCMTIFNSYQGRPTESEDIISPQEPPVADARPYSLLSRTTPTKEDPQNQKISSLRKNHPSLMHDHIQCFQEQLLPRKTHWIRRYLSTRTTSCWCTTIFDVLKNNSYQGRPTESEDIISPQEPPVADARPYSMLSRTTPTKEDPPNQKISSLTRTTRIWCTTIFDAFKNNSYQDPPNQKISSLHENHPSLMHDHIRCSQEQLLPRKTHRIRRYHLSTRTTRCWCTTIFDALKNNSYQGLVSFQISHVSFV